MVRESLEEMRVNQLLEEEVQQLPRFQNLSSSRRNLAKQQELPEPSQRSQEGSRHLADRRNWRSLEFRESSRDRADRKNWRSLEFQESSRDLADRKNWWSSEFRESSRDLADRRNWMPPKFRESSRVLEDRKNRWSLEFRGSSRDLVDRRSYRSQEIRDDHPTSGWTRVQKHWTEHAQFTVRKTEHN